VRPHHQCGHLHQDEARPAARFTCLVRIWKQTDGQTGNRRRAGAESIAQARMVRPAYDGAVRQFTLLLAGLPSRHDILQGESLEPPRVESD